MAKVPTDPNEFRDKLSMIDEKGHRKFIIPAAVSGVWRTRRTWVHGVLLAFYFFAPWVSFQGKPLIQLNLATREFHLFGLTLFAHDGPLLFFFLALLVLGLIILTTLFGRVWCGWACPQTVFLDGVIRRIEFWTEGSYLKRRQLEQAPFSIEKAARRLAKWLLFSVFVFALTHTFLSYFVGADRVLEMTSLPPSENWHNFIFVWVLSGILLFDLAWFREQFCVIMCPYGRFQAAMLDQQSVTVAYDFQRGEPRKGLASAALTSENNKTLEGQRPGAEKPGDCVACNRCVQVCPTGIDIRNGLQMECIACTACIDACDEIMEKVGKLKGLIRYKPLDPDLPKPHWFRARVIAYIAIWFVLFASATYAINSRSELKAILLRQSGLPYQIQRIEDGYSVINTYRVHLINHRAAENLIRIEVNPPHFEWLGQKPELRLEPREDRIMAFALKDQRQFGGILPINESGDTTLSGSDRVTNRDFTEKVAKVQLRVIEIGADSRDLKELQVLSLPFIYPDQQP